MHAMTYFLPEARDLIRPVWTPDGNRMAGSAVRWLYSEPGAEAYVKFAFRMVTAKEIARADQQRGQQLLDLTREIYQLEAEIAARRAGWCPELDLQPEHAPELTTDC